MVKRNLKWVIKMARKESINKIMSELQKGVNLAKCRKCGCMKETLEVLLASFQSIKSGSSSDVLKNIELMLSKMEPIRYACLGCEHCYPAVAMDVFNKAFPKAESHILNCAFEVRGGMACCRR